MRLPVRGVTGCNLWTKNWRMDGETVVLILVCGFLFLVCLCLVSIFIVKTDSEYETIHDNSCEPQRSPLTKNEDKMYGTFLLKENSVFQTPLITSTPQRKDEYNYLTPYLCDSSSSNSSSLISSKYDMSSSKLNYREDVEEPKTDPLHHDHKYISLYEDITNKLSKSCHSEHYSENNEIRYFTWIAPLF